MGYLEIRSWLDADKVLYSGEAESLKELVERAVKEKANLSSADLYSANLSSANLRSADLYSANLRSANLSLADLRSANLISANLRSANLYSANLRSANLSSADLSSANLRSADLRSANLRSANLSSADLYSANLRSAKNADLVIARLSIVPEGCLIGWKKCRNDVIVRLSVPEEAKRSNAYGRKCRAEFVDTLEIFGGEVGVSLHDGQTEYRVGHRTKCHEWSGDRFTECGGGLHFYLTRIEAENHE